MPRPFRIPDPRDRSVNNPTELISSTQVLGLYTQETGDKKERVVESVQKWYIEKMKEVGWSKASFHGNSCLLEADIRLNISSK